MIDKEELPEASPQKTLISGGVDRGREEEISLPDALYVITLASLGFQMILCCFCLLCKDASFTVAFVYCPGAQPQSGCEGGRQNSQKARTSVPGIWQVLGISVAHVIHNISIGGGAVCLFVNGEIEAEVRQDGCPWPQQKVSATPRLSFTGQSDWSDSGGGNPGCLVGAGQGLVPPGPLPIHTGCLGCTGTARDPPAWL